MCTDGVLRDGYGYRVRDSVARHPKCKCKVACQRRFRCECPTHCGSRMTPWCNGEDDELERKFGPICDDCAMAARALLGKS